MTDRQGLQAVASVSLGEGGPLGACPWNHRLLQLTSPQSTSQMGSGMKAIKTEDRNMCLEMIYWTKRGWTRVSTNKNWLSSLVHGVHGHKYFTLIPTSVVTTYKHTNIWTYKHIYQYSRRSIGTRSKPFKLMGLTCYETRFPRDVTDSSESHKEPRKSQDNETNSPELTWVCGDEDE